MILQAYEYEQREKKPKFLQEFFDSTKGFFENVHPLLKNLVDQLYEAREQNKSFCILPAKVK